MSGDYYSVMEFKSLVSQGEIFINGFFFFFLDIKQNNSNIIMITIII